MKTGLVKVLFPAILLSGLALVQAACTATGKSVGKAGLVNGETGSSSAESKAAQAALASVESDVADSACPQIRILEGTGVLTAYASEGNEKAENVAHQATIVQSGRKCTLKDGNLTLRIATAGRAAKGPKSVGNTVTLPIRIAVVRGESEVLFSQLYNQLVAFTGPAAQDFTFVEEDIGIPADKAEKPVSIRILIGFDTGTGGQA